MGQTPAQPSTPPKGTSPSPNIQRGVNQAWDSWHQHGNKDPKAALANQRPEVPVKGNSK